MKEGFSLTGFAGQIGVSRSTIGEWMNEYPDFSAACNVGKAVRAYCWEDRMNRVGERGGGPGTAQVIQFALKNLAADEYRDKVDHSLSGPNGGPIQTEDVSLGRESFERRIAGVAARFGAGEPPSKPH